MPITNRRRGADRLQKVAVFVSIALLASCAERRASNTSSPTSRPDVTVGDVVERQAERPSFEAYGVPLYNGQIHLPKWIQREDDGSWQDDLGKLVAQPEVNFAGKYFMAVHSCGTGCRFYTLTDLSSGRERDLLTPFATAEPPPKTADGHEYLTVLHGRPHSRMLVAQDYVQTTNNTEECRERVSLLENERLVEVRSVARGCREI
jgi:hypothetical protein